jgi:hypothetical protein
MYRSHFGKFNEVVCNCIQRVFMLVGAAHNAAAVGDCIVAATTGADCNSTLVRN